MVDALLGVVGVDVDDGDDGVVAVALGEGEQRVVLRVEEVQVGEAAAARDARGGSR